MIHKDLKLPKTELPGYCRRNGIRRLELFGSATRADFGPQSDVDLLVEFEPSQSSGAADRYFGLLEDLTSLLGRPVELVVARAVRNPYLRESIEASRRSLYVAPPTS